LAGVLKSHITFLSALYQVVSLDDVHRIKIEKGNEYLQRNLRRNIIHKPGKSQHDTSHSKDTQQERECTKKYKATHLFHIILIYTSTDRQ
jgi:hypothetical protein